MTWPIIEGTSLLHLHTHRGKKSVTLNLKLEEGKTLYKELVATADVVVEAQKPGALAASGSATTCSRRSILDRVRHPVGIRLHRPYRDMPSHGIAYDTWAGIVQPVTDDDGFTRIPKDMPNVGINVGPMVAAMGILAGIIKARETGSGARWSSPSRMLPPTWTGIASRPSGRTCARGRGHRQPGRQLRAAPCRPGRHVGGRALSDVRGQ